MTEAKKKIEAYKEMLSEAYKSMPQEAYREMVGRTYEEMVGDSIFTAKVEDISPYGNYPVLRADEPRLKADRTAYEGVVPKYANAKLPAVEYTMTSW